MAHQVERELSPETLTNLVVEDGDNFDKADGDDDKIHICLLHYWLKAF